jgi:hypothetical protein
MSLKTIFRGVVATSALCCLVSLGAVAQDQATAAGSQSTTKSKTSQKSTRVTPRWHRIAAAPAVNLLPLISSL